MNNQGAKFNAKDQNPKRWKRRIWGYKENAQKRRTAEYISKLA